MSLQQQQQQQANYNDADDPQALQLHLRPLTNVRGHDVESQSRSSATTDLFAVDNSRHSFDSHDSYFHSSDADDGLDKTLDKRKRTVSWWDKLLLMAVKRRHSPGRTRIHKHLGGNNPLLGTGLAFRRAKRRNLYNWCIFGGISGAGLLYVCPAVPTVLR
jgi:hypothetical protein